MLEFLRFVLWPGKSQAEIIRIPNVPKPPVVRVKWIAFRETLTLFPSFEGFLSIVLFAVVLLSYSQSMVDGVPLSLFASCVCWKQHLLDVLVQSIQLAITEDW